MSAKPPFAPVSEGQATNHYQVPKDFYFIFAASGIASPTEMVALPKGAKTLKDLLAQKATLNSCASISSMPPLSRVNAEEPLTAK